MKIGEVSVKNLITIVVVALAAYYLGQSTSSRYEGYHNENLARFYLLDKRTGVLHYQCGSEWCLFTQGFTKLGK